jgi:hypothetical protein
MKKIIIIVLLGINISTKAQNLTPNDLLKINNYQSPIPTKYRLYPTNNGWVFLRLNTTNGLIDMVVYNFKEEVNQEIIKLNNEPLVENGMLDRYKLQATSNGWIFILFDQVEGKVYKVQWGDGADNRSVKPIL